MPLLPGNILFTLGPDDLANHVRHAYEYGLALKQHQLPPLVAPTLNGDQRIPLFQYYSGTGYLIPGTLSALGIDAYFALKLAIALHLAAGGLFSYLLCRRLGIRQVPALTAGTAFELFPFIGTDLLGRGAYPEVMAGTAMPLLLYLVVGLVQALGRGPILRNLCLAALAWAYVLAIHPIQAVLGSALVIALGTIYAMLDLADRSLRQRLRASAAIFGALGIALIGTLWFWWPIVRDHGALRIVDYQQFGDAGLNHLAVLLWPGYREADGVAGWAPQLGLHVAVSAVVAIVWLRRTSAVAVASGLIVCAIVVVIRWHAGIPFADRLFEPLQWTYRLLIPAALAGMLCLGFVLDAVERRFPDRRGGLIAGLCFGYVIALGIPYFADRGLVYDAFGSGHVTSPDFRSPNADFYGLRGSDFRQIPFVQNGALATGVDLGIRGEGGPFHVRLVVRPPTPGARLAVLVNGRPAPGATVLEQPGGRTLVINVGLHPTTGNVATGSRVLRFEASTSGQVWQVSDLSFHPDGDPAGEWVRLPQTIAPAAGTSTAWNVDVPTGKAGLYQLPFLHLPSSVQFVDGHETPQSSSDRFMTIVPLHSGENLVRFETRTSDFGLPGLAVLLLAAAGAGVSNLIARRRSGVFDAS